MISELTYRPQGAAKKLFELKAPEVLFEGPAGCGKTRAVGELVNYLCETYPGIRVLFCRQTRASLSETVMPIFEQHVLWPGHPVLESGGGTSRTHYQYPNGSRIVLQGLEEPGRTYSSQYDVVVVFEAWEVSLTAWQMLARACRNGVLPWQMMIAETNPAEETHWLNRRGDTLMVRIKGRHEDNPSLRPEYLERLSRLTGFLRARLYLGEWCGVSGMVWETFDPNIHVLKGLAEEDWQRFGWYFGAMDWGFTDPGCLGIYGVIPGATRDNDTICLVAEWYHTGKSIDWWAEQAVRADQEFGLSVVVCDPSRPDCIAKFNDMIGHARQRGMSGVARAANNQRRSVRDLAGLDLVRWAFSAADEFGPRLYLLEDALQHPPDPALVAKSKPTCTREEIPGYAFETDNDGEAIEETKRDAADHGCDQLRYASTFAWKRDMTPPIPPKVYPKWSYGEVLGLNAEDDA